MIALSSHRPFVSSPEYAANQTRASQSWRDKFSNIYYVGHYEEGLNGEHTLFVRPEGDYPTIKLMAEFAAQLTAEYVAILNADIVIGSGIVDVERRMRDMALPAATSYRYEFDPANPDFDNATRHKEDRGMDIFVANPKIWALVARDVPSDLLFGHNRWDSWVCGYFCDHLGYGFRHFSFEKCVFHPKHEGRMQPHLDSIKTDSPYFTRAKRPSPLC